MEKNHRILVVDDDESNLKLLRDRLAGLGYEVICVRSGAEALDMVGGALPDLILLACTIADMRGFELAGRLREGGETRLIPILMVCALNDVENRLKALDAGVDDFLSLPIHDIELRSRVKTLLKVKAYNDTMLHYKEQLDMEVTSRTEYLQQAIEQLKSVTLESINRLARAAEYKDIETGEHILRMGRYAVAVAKELELDEYTQEVLLYSVPMHDVGKIGVPDQILLKPGKLDPNEWEIMKRHTVIGARILEGSKEEIIQAAEIIALTHHERWDGSGYPQQMKEDTIPLFGRITAVADVFDALTSRRPYKKPFSLEESLSILKEGRGSHFDPRVLDAFFSVEDNIFAIREEIQDREESRFMDMQKRAGFAKE